MIDKNLIENVKQLAAERVSDHVHMVLATGEHDKRDELKGFLLALAEASEFFHFEESDIDLPSPISFTLQNAQGETGIIFSGIPGGHEFSSLVLALLQAGGSPLKLDESLQNLLRGAQPTLRFETYISLSCHNCPDVVQTLNQFALLSPNISNEMIDGGLFQDKIEANNIQGVPAVYLNGKPFANGKIDTAKLVDKLLEAHPELSETAVAGEQLPLQDMVIIGGGPAGVSAAIYGARKGLAVTLVADRIGGQVKDTMDIENLIGVSKTTGPELSGKLLSHMQDYPVTIKEGFMVKSVVPQDKGHQITLSTGEVIDTKTVIVASGAKWRELGVPGERENIGNGVAYCPHCDGPFFKGKHVAVIGGGNSGVEAALDLAGIVKQVTVFEFMPELKADKVLVDALAKRDNIDVITHAATKEILAIDGKVNAIVYQDRETDATNTLELAGIFVQIGLVPNSEFLGDLVEKTKFGEIQINERGETNVPGIFACGDVTTVPYKQIVIAMGEGSKAALSAFDYLIRQ